jgi:hypothetical protein
MIQLLKEVLNIEEKPSSLENFKVDKLRKATFEIRSATRQGEPNT